MPEYIAQKHLPGNDFGEWSDGIEFSADNDEEATNKATEVLMGKESLVRKPLFSHTRFRVTRVVFVGRPTETGHPLPRDEFSERLEAEQTSLTADLYVKAKGATLDYSGDDLRFSMKIVPVDSHGPGSAGYYLRLLYTAGKGSMLSVSEKELANARDIAELAPGDTTLSAHYFETGLHGGYRCVSVSKVMGFQGDGRTPKELIHLWPLEFENLAIEADKLAGVAIEDHRE